MHVLTLTPFYPTRSNDASGCFIAEPIAALREFGIKHSVIAVRPFYRQHDSVDQSANDASWISYPSLPGNIGLSSSGSFLNAVLRKKLRELNRSLPVDLIHAHGALPCGHAAMLLARELRVPFIVTVHGLDAYFTRQVPGYAGKLCRRICTDVYQASRRVVCISGKVRAEVLSGASRAVMAEVIYNSADPRLFFPALDSTRQRTILSVGNLIPIKGHETLLWAIAGLPSTFGDVQCEIVGEGPECSRLLKLARELKIAERVHFLGTRSRAQVAEAMRHCTVFALPSRYEGLGCVYLEAMASQKPAIGVRGQAIEEVIAHRTTGWLAEPGDVRNLSESLVRLLSDEALRSEISLGARQAIMQRFTVQHQASQLAELYSEAA